MSEDFLAHMRSLAQTAMDERNRLDEERRAAEAEAAHLSEAEARETRKNELLEQRTALFERVSEEKNDSERLAFLESELAQYQEVAEMFAQAQISAPTIEMVEFNERYDALQAEAARLRAKSPFNPAAEYRQLDEIDKNPDVMDHLRDEANSMNTEFDKKRETEQLERDLAQAVEGVREFLLKGDWHPHNYLSESTIQFEIVAKFDEKVRHREEIDWYTYAHLEYKLKIEPSKILQSEPVQNYNKIIQRLNELK
jgi:hypothetical protein